MVEQLHKKAANGAQIAKPPFLKIFSIQILALVCVSVLLLLVDVITAYSALLGGLISIGPNAYFARVAFRYSGARSAYYVAKSLYRGEIGKFLLVSVLFACVFVLVKPLAPGTLFVAFIVTMILNWILLWRWGNF